jgi:acetoin utilization deacetylase AcuC-like enzyme
MRVTDKGFSRMASGLLAVARKHADGRCAAVLEGGYSLEGLKEGVQAVLDEMGGFNHPQASSHGSQADELIGAVADVQKRFWQF